MDKKVRDGKQQALAVHDMVCKSEKGDSYSLVRDEE